MREAGGESHRERPTETGTVRVDRLGSGDVEVVGLSSHPEWNPRGPRTHRPSTYASNHLTYSGGRRETDAP